MDPASCQRTEAPRRRSDAGVCKPMIALVPLATILALRCSVTGGRLHVCAGCWFARFVTGAIGAAFVGRAWLP